MDTLLDIYEKANKNPGKGSIAKKMALLSPDFFNDFLLEDRTIKKC